jgi:hypothetical protein
MQLFIDCLLAVACRWCGLEAAEGLVLSLVGASVALLEVESRCEGLEAELGDVSDGIVWLCAITIAPGARVIKAANKSVLRGPMRPLLKLKVPHHGALRLKGTIGHRLRLAWDRSYATGQLITIWL